MEDDNIETSEYLNDSEMSNNSKTLQKILLKLREEEGATKEARHHQSAMFLALIEFCGEQRANQTDQV